MTITKSLVYEIIGINKNSFSNELKMQFCFKLSHSVINMDILKVQFYVIYNTRNLIFNFK